MLTRSQRKQQEAGGGVGSDRKQELSDRLTKKVKKNDEQEGNKKKSSSQSEQKQAQKSEEPLQTPQKKSKGSESVAKLDGSKLSTSKSHDSKPGESKLGENSSEQRTKNQSEQMEVEPSIRSFPEPSPIKNQGQNEFSASKNPSLAKQGSENSLIVNQQKFFKCQSIEKFYEAYGRVKKKYLIGKGAYGSVYKVNHSLTKEWRALKIIENISNFDQKIFEAQFNREIEILKSLDHPNIIKVYEVFQSKNTVYVVSEYVQGRDLLDEILQRDDFSELDAAIIMKQLLQGLNYAHQFGLIHRDVKPENILVEVDKNSANQALKIKIIDWETGSKFQKGAYLQELKGSYEYLAPEVYQSKYNEKADIWSAGVILHILLSGENPYFQRTISINPSQVIQFRENQVQNIERTEIKWEKFSPEAKDLLSNMLKIDFNERYSAQQCLDHPWFKSLIENPLSTQDKNQMQMNLARIKQNMVHSKLIDAIKLFMGANMVSKPMREDLERQFKALDKNGDGMITREEINEVFQKNQDEMDQEEIEELFKSIDTDNDGHISYSEFIAASLDKNFILSKQKLKEAFNYFDKDKNGFIDSEELKELFQVREDQDAEIWKQMISQVDTNGDSQISFVEFEQFINSKLGLNK